MDIKTALAIHGFAIRDFEFTSHEILVEPTITLVLCGKQELAIQGQIFLEHNLRE